MRNPYLYLLLYDTSVLCMVCETWSSGDRAPNLSNGANTSYYYFNAFKRKNLQEFLKYCHTRYWRILLHIFTPLANSKSVNRGKIILNRSGGRETIVYYSLYFLKKSFVKKSFFSKNNSSWFNKSVLLLFSRRVIVSLSLEYVCRCGIIRPLNEVNQALIAWSLYTLMIFITYYYKTAIVIVYTTGVNAYTYMINNLNLYKYNIIHWLFFNLEISSDEIWCIRHLIAWHIHLISNCFYK